MQRRLNCFGLKRGICALFNSTRVLRLQKFCKVLFVQLLLFCYFFILNSYLTKLFLRFTIQGSVKIYCNSIAATWAIISIAIFLIRPINTIAIYCNSIDFYSFIWGTHETIKALEHASENSD